MMKTLFGMLKSLLVGKGSLRERADLEIAEAHDVTNEFDRGRMIGRAEACRAIERRILDELDPKVYREIASDEIADREDTDERLRETILRKWTRARDETERNSVLSEMFAARTAIRNELIPSEPELNKALGSLENRLDSIMKGGYNVAPLDIAKDQNEGADYGSQRELPLVNLAAYIATLVVLRAEQQRRILSEWGEWYVCETRVNDAMKARKLPAKSNAEFAMNIGSVDKHSVDCRICKAKKGDPCVQPKR
jgi:hypothetical protein